LTPELDLQDPAIVREVLAFAVEAARHAGRLALGFFQHGAHTHATVNTKHGGSPVTEADLLANSALEQRLKARFPEAGWLSEETVDDPSRLSRRVVVIVDPIDGTRGFVAGDPRWAVSVGFVLDGRPIVGVVHAPALDETYAAVRGEGATLNGASIAVSNRTVLAGARAAGPKASAAAVLTAGLPLEIIPKIPSLAYRLAQVARGTIDVAIASGDSHDWDIAAADLIVHEAGGRLTSLDGEVPTYNRHDLTHGALYAASACLHNTLLEAAKCTTPPSATVRA